MNSGEEASFGKISVLYILLSLALTFGIFIALPQIIVYVAGLFVGAGWIANSTSVGFHLLVGAAKLLVFVLYFVALGSMSAGKRLFSYHGAEHKVANCYEDSDSKLTPFNAKRHSRIHVRCGTTFLFIAILFSILVYTVVFSFIGIQSQIVMLAVKLLLLPFLAGGAYEFLMKWGAKVPPALWMQKLTTREPSSAQLEVAIAALEAVTK